MSARKEASVSVRRRTAFSTIPNHLIRDMSISPEARLLLCYIMSCSDSWVFYVSECQKILGCGKDKWQRIRKEVIDAGYLRVHVKNGDGGRLEGYIWEVFDEPQNEDAAPDAEGTSGELAQDVGEVASNREPENPALGDEANSDAHREPEKPASRLNPPAGFSGPLRKNNKQKEQQTSCADEPAPMLGVCSDDLLKDFERVFPKLGTAEGTRKGIGKALATGATPEQIIAAARAYASEQQGNDPKYVRRGDRFFVEDFWRAYVPAVTKTPSATEAEFVARWAKTIREIGPGHFMFGKVSRDTVTRCLVAGAVTPEDCRRAGMPVEDRAALGALEVAV